MVEEGGSGVVVWLVGEAAEKLEEEILSSEIEARVEEATVVVVETTSGVWLECTLGVDVECAKEVLSDLEMEADAVMGANVDSDVETCAGAEVILDSGTEEMSCLLADAEADAEELGATVDDDSCVLTKAEAEALCEIGKREDSWLLADANADTDEE
jgi:vacuolar-type H+-ATPase subunit H